MSINSQLSLSEWDYLTPGGILDYLTKRLNILDELEERKSGIINGEEDNVTKEAQQRDFDDF